MNFSVYKKHMLKLGLIPASALAFTSNAQAAQPTNAYEWDIKFIRKVLDTRQQSDFMDFGLLELQRLEKEYTDPKRQQELALYKAAFYSYLKQGRRFDETIALITEDSPFYPQSRMLMGIHTAPSDQGQAIGYLVEYFKLVPKPGESDLDVKEWKNSIFLLSKLYEMTGKVKEAVETIDLVKELPEGTSARDLYYRKASIILRSQEELVLSGKKADAKLVDEALALLEENVWETDTIGILSMVEKARAFYVQGNPKKAMGEIKTITPTLKDFQGQMLKQLSEKQVETDSPIAPALLIFSRSAVELAKTDKARAVAYYSAALKQLAALRQRYEPSEAAADALTLIADLKEKLTKDFAWTNDKFAAISEVLVSETGEMKLLQAQATTAFANKNFKEAEALYKSAFEKAGDSSDGEDIFFYMVMSAMQNADGRLNNEGKFEELETLGNEFIKKYPKSTKVSDILYRIGSFYIVASKDKEGDEKVKFRRLAQPWFDRYVDIEPFDERAATLRLMGLNDQYTQLKTAHHKAQLIADDAEKRTKQAEINDSLNALIASLTIMVNDYEGTAQSNQARSIIGQCYVMLEQYEMAAEAFKAYAETLNDPEKVKDRIAMMLNASQYLTLAEKWEEAQQTLDQLIAEIGTSEDLIEEKAAAMFRKAQVFTTQSRGFDIEAFELKKTIAEEKNQIRSYQIELSKLTQQAEELALAKKRMVDAHSEDLDGARGYKLSDIDGGNLKGDNPDDAAKLNKAKETFRRAESGRLSGEPARIADMKARAYEAINTGDAEIKKIEAQRSNAQATIDKNERSIDPRKALLASKRKQLETAESKFAKEQEKLNGLRERVFEFKEKLSAPTLGDVAKAELQQGLTEVLEEVSSYKKEYDKALASYETQSSKLRTELREGKEQLETWQQEIEESRRILNDTVAVLKLYKAQKTYGESLLATAKVAEEKLANDRKVFGGQLSLAEQDKDIARLVEATKKTHALESAWMAERVAVNEQQVAAKNATIAKVEQAIADHEAGILPLEQNGRKVKAEEVKAYESFLAEFPDNEKFGAQAYARAGNLYAYLGQSDKSSKYLKTLKDKYPQDPAVKTSMRELAKAYLDLNDYSRAATTFEKEIIPRAQEFTAGQLVAMQDLCLTSYSDAQPLSKKMLKVVVDLGKEVEKMATRRGDQQELAKKYLGQVYNMSMQALSAEEKWSEVVTVADKLLKRNPNSKFQFDAYYLKGMAAAAQGKYDEAVTNFAGVFRSPDQTQILQASYQSILAKEQKLKKTTGNEARHKLASEIAGELGIAVMSVPPGDEMLAEIHEDCYVRLVKLLRQLGNRQLATEKAAAYRKAYPNGKRAGAIQNALTTSADSSLAAPKPAPTQK